MCEDVTTKKKKKYEELGMEAKTKSVRKYASIHSATPYIIKYSTGCDLVGLEADSFQNLFLTSS